MVSTTVKSFTLPSGREMAYSISPGPSHRVVLLSNSLAEDLTSWDLVVPVLENQGFRVLRYDQPGHGRSTAPPEAELSSMTFDIMAEDVAHLLKYLGIARLHAFIGVSMGGITAIYFAVLYPGIVNKLVIADALSTSPVAAGIPDNFAVRVSAVQKARSITQDLSDTRKRWFGEEWLAGHPEEAARIEKAMATTTIQGLETCCAALRKPDFDMRPMYSKISHGCDEALIVVGEKDADMPIKMKDMRRDIEESLRKGGKKVPVNMEIVKGAGHVPYIDGFENFCGIITKFLV